MTVLEDTRDHFDHPEDGRATAISTLNISHDNSRRVCYGGRDVQHRPERGYEELDRSCKMAALSWQREKLVPVPAYADEEDIEHQHFRSPESLLAAAKFLPPKKLLMGKKKGEELEPRKHMKERWNCEYDKPVTVAGDYGGYIREKRRKDWAASSGGHYSDYLPSNEKGRPPGHQRYAKQDRRYNDADEASKGGELQHRHYPSEADGRPPLPKSSSSYPYQSQQCDKDIEETGLCDQHQRNLTHRQHQQEHHSTKPKPPRTVGHSSFQPYQLSHQDVPRDAHTRRPTTVVAGTVKMTPAEVFPSTAPLKQRALQAAGPKAASGYANSAAQGWQYMGRQPRYNQDGYVSIEDKNRKTTNYHYEDFKEYIEKRQEVLRK